MILCTESPPTSGKGATSDSPDKPVKRVQFGSPPPGAGAGGEERNRQQRGAMAAANPARENVEGKTPSKDTTNTDSRSLSVVNRSQTNSSTLIKGTCAKFLRQNPRFINEPICHVLPNEYSASVGACMSWSTSADSVSRVATTIQDRYEATTVKLSTGHSNES